MLSPMLRKMCSLSIFAQWVAGERLNKSRSPRGEGSRGRVANSSNSAKVAPEFELRFWVNGTGHLVDKIGVSIPHLLHMII